MMQAMRDGAQTTAFKVIIVLIVISFAGFGLESLLPSGSGNAVAEVNGEEISPFELDRAVASRKQQLEQVFGDRINPEMLADERVRPIALEGLIQREIILQTAHESGMVASDRLVGKYVAEIDAFKVDGKFNADQYKFVLMNAGLSPERFRRTQAEDILLDQVRTAVSQSAFVTSLELEAAASVTAEERDVRFLEIDGDKLLSDSAITDEEVATVYEQDKSKYMTDPAVIADYLVLSAEDFIKPVAEADIREAFETVEADFQVADQASVSHILLVQGDDENDADFAARVTSVETRLADGEDFATVATEASDDLGSAPFGGDLGLTDGNAFPEPMEKAIAALGVGEISAAVETEAGTHFIKLNERMAGQAPTFEDMRMELENSIAESEAQQDLLIAVDTVRDIGFNSVDLRAPAEAIGAEVQRSAPVTEVSGEGVFADPKVRTALFAEDVFELGNNSEVLELEDGSFVAVRVAEKVPPQQRPLEEVAAEIRSELEAKKLEDALVVLKAAAEQSLKDGKTLEDIAQEQGLEWRVELAARRNNSALPRPVMTAAFAMQPGETALERVQLGANRYALVQLARVRAGDIEALSEAEKSGIRAQMSRMAGQTAFEQFLTARREASEIIVR